jgi:hypothetical protein
MPPTEVLASAGMPTAIEMPKAEWMLQLLIWLFSFHGDKDLFTLMRSEF